MPAPEVSLTFSTTGLNTTPVNSLTAEAQQVYDFLVENFETRTLSATMAVDGVSGQTGSWNTADAEQVYQWTGQYPAMIPMDRTISGYELLRLPALGFFTFQLD